MLKMAGLISILGLTLPLECFAATYYIRQTIGDDANDGLTPATAWKSLSKLTHAMKAGDTAYVGPGLYREQVNILESGTPDHRIIFAADPTGQHTGDPPGVVMVTGADPVDESIFTPYTSPGVYTAKPGGIIEAVVEMDGDQYRYARARDTMEHLKDNLSELETVEKLPASQYFDRENETLYIHTSDGKPPTTHEIELIRRGNGFGTWDKDFITISGFTFRHMGDSAISFFYGSNDVAAINNVSYGGRQGIRVYNATQVLVYGNTLFRNDNSGVYFVKEAVDGVALGNVAYENIKGLRWSSNSVNGIVLDNVAFDNREGGIALEDADRAIVRGNILVNNGAQLMPERSTIDSENNCFEKKPDQLIADFVLGPKYKTLGDYQREKGMDTHSRDGNCGPLPAKVDVHKLHAETMAYAERARKILSEQAAAATATPQATATAMPRPTGTPMPQPTRTPMPQVTPTATPQVTGTATAEEASAE
jgi:parallel beta-helix repeat protein